jgi:hypothetical protein
MYTDQLSAALRFTILLYARKNHVDDAVAFAMFEAIHRQVVEAALADGNAAAMLREIQDFAVRMWTSAESLRLADGNGVEMCRMINYALFMDDEEMLPHVTPLVRAINQLCVTRNHPERGVPWPADFTTYRGGRLPDERRSFFTPGKKYRCPSLLATSASLDVAMDFMRRAQQPRVLWRVHVDPRRRCVHVNYVERVTAVPGEQEFLYAAYSTFTVQAITYNADQHWVVDLFAAPDNRDESEHLPLSPWS